MLGSLISWFKALSAAGKVGVVTVAIVTGGIGASAMSSPSQKSVISNEPECISKVSRTIKSEVIKFKTNKVKDSYLDKGKTETRIAGINGKKELTYETTTYNPAGCNEDKTELVKEKVTKEPVNKVVAIGNYVAPEQETISTTPSNCNPNYSGCVPNAYDVDCAGGSGNGPAYTGTVTVIGTDVYGLDYDGDGVGCE